MKPRQRTTIGLIRPTRTALTNRFRKRTWAVGNAGDVEIVSLDVVAPMPGCALEDFNNASTKFDTASAEDNLSPIQPTRVRRSIRERRTRTRQRDVDHASIENSRPTCKSFF